MAAEPSVAGALTVSPEFLRDRALGAVLAVLPGVRLVGGCVRDALAGRPVADIDLATPDPPERVVDRLRGAGIKVVPTGLKHGTVTAVVDGRPFEVTTLREDLDTDGRHATVSWTEDWRQDAARRDFTMNAMSMSPDGRVHDYFGGAEDLRAGRVRFVGDAAARVAEDYLRVLRFFRFLARYGRGMPDPAALGAVRAGVAGLQRLSPERVWSELKRILAVPDAGTALALMADSGVLTAVLPGFAGTGLAARLPPDPLLRLAAMTTGAADLLADGLRMSNEERRRLRDMQAPVLADDATDDDARRALADWPAESLADAAWLAGQDGAGMAARLARLDARFTLEGRDVVAAGVPPGPEVGRLLRAVRTWWLAGGARADASACRAELARLVAAGRQVAEGRQG